MLIGIIPGTLNLHSKRPYFNERLKNPNSSEDGIKLKMNNCLLSYALSSLLIVSFSSQSIANGCDDLIVRARNNTDLTSEAMVITNRSTDRVYYFIPPKSIFLFPTVINSGGRNKIRFGLRLTPLGSIIFPDSFILIKKYYTRVSEIPGEIDFSAHPIINRYYKISISNISIGKCDANENARPGEITIDINKN